MNQALSKEYIESVAKALIEATPEEVIEFQQLLEVHPRGHEIHEAVAAEMIGMFLDQLIGGLGFASMSEVEEECDCDEVCALEAEEPTLAEVLASQVTAQQLSKSIRDQMNPENVYIRPVFVDYIKPEPAKDLVSSIKEQCEELAAKKLADYIKAQVEAAPVIDLASVIKGQVEQQTLTATIQKQIEDELTQFIGHAVTGQITFTLEEVLESILDEVVDEIIESDVLQELFSLHSSSIGLYEIVFASEFNAKVNGKAIPEIVEYKPEYTAYIMTELASYLVEECGYELAFEVIEGNLIPVLKA